MKKALLFLSSIVLGALLFNSCSKSSIKEKAKEATKTVTEVGMSAAEGIAEAIDENGAQLAEKTTDAAGSLALGAGRSIDRQLNEHATKVAAVAGRTLVQTADGLVDGVSDEVKTHYVEVPHSENICDGVKLDYIAKFKQSAIIDAYFVIEKEGTYDYLFELYNKNNEVFLTRDATTVKDSVNTGTRRIVSFALTQSELEKFDSNLKEIKVTVTKKN
ncbi:hypothetical protein [Dysgonomonas sp. 25]|uniref:hypothetical protein n=1 Tax=Dysgonomonas sp. 25 TaxID=2302933 RepID=UPI0013D44C56|nr:hypothetical protein [Dysgonomonas sp. 25]NDV68374.1 hypothetical protein [Dysgonomonas sp. 25]